jgi:GxxExxY protein
LRAQNARQKSQKKMKIQNHSAGSWAQYPLSNLTDRIIGCAIKVHKALGPGFVEKIYQAALAREFINNKLSFEKEKRISVRYENTIIGYQIVDLMVEESVIVELKAVSELSDIHASQMVSYLKAANKEVGLILNFAKSKLDIKRIKL